MSNEWSIFSEGVGRMERTDGCKRVKIVSSFSHAGFFLFISIRFYRSRHDRLELYLFQTFLSSFLSFTGPHFIAHLSIHRWIDPILGSSFHHSIQWQWRDVDKAKAKANERGFIDQFSFMEKPSSLAGWMEPNFFFSYLLSSFHSSFYGLGILGLWFIRLTRSFNEWMTRTLIDRLIDSWIAGGQKRKKEENGRKERWTVSILR